MSKAEEKKVFCYNFSAKEMDAHYEEDADPIILDTFTTTLTAYECQSEDASGIVIPEKL